MVLFACVKHIILCSLKKSAESTGSSLFCVCVSLQFWNEIWGKTAFHLFYLQKREKKEKKNPFLWFRSAALATSLVPSLSLSSGFHSLSKWHLRMTRASRVSWAEGRKRGAEGENEGASTIHLTFPQHQPGMPASLQSVLLWAFYSTREQEKKINSYFHNPHSCLSTCLCVSPSSIPLFLTPPLSPLG